MCIFCWQETEETGIQPVVNESKWLNRDLSSVRSGKGNYIEDPCRFCEWKGWQAKFVAQERY